ncbi:hypothetical protein AAVH_22136 [Aphelenchoides avenae]|nr:hypothetical protein AAVH_22136 [Aphelenchus avenae]
MRLAVTRLMPVLRFRNGEQKWVEVQESRLPAGRKKFKVGLTMIYTVMGLCAFGTYAYAKAWLNPETEWAKLGDKLFSIMGQRKDLGGEDMEEPNLLKKKKKEEEEPKFFRRSLF